MCSWGSPNWQVRIDIGMAWHLFGAKPLPEPWMTHLLMYTCGARHQWVNLGYHQVKIRMGTVSLIAKQGKQKYITFYRLIWFTCLFITPLFFNGALAHSYINVNYVNKSKSYRLPFLNIFISLDTDKIWKFMRFDDTVSHDYTIKLPKYCQSWLHN